MADQEEPQACHCHHVVELKVKVGAFQWLMGICLVGVLGVAGTLVGQFISNRLTWADRASNNERLFIDRVSRPDAPKESEGHGR